jgi:hypothetical protein
MTSAAAPPPTPDPDDKDWTWVLDRPCAECGFQSGAVPREQLGSTALAAVAVLVRALGRDDATVRPSPTVWSSLEYGAHVRDVCRMFHGRLDLMLAEDDPLFANWDQDATALEERYWQQQPAAVAADLDAAAHQMAAALGAVGADQWGRPGRRSNGSVFTVESLGRYFAHDVVHHAHDVGA